MTVEHAWGYGRPALAAAVLLVACLLPARGEDADPASTSWTGLGDYFGDLVIDQAPTGGKGPLGHFRR